MFEKERVVCTVIIDPDAPANFCEVERRPAWWGDEGVRGEGESGACGIGVNGIQAFLHGRADVRSALAGGAAIGCIGRGDGKENEKSEWAEETRSHVEVNRGSVGI